MKQLSQLHHLRLVRFRRCIGAGSRQRQHLSIS
jgi:hypothetical protein